jgi:hypothetical protein
MRGPAEWEQSCAVEYEQARSGMARGVDTHGHEPIKGAVRARVSILVRRERLIWSRRFNQAVARQSFDHDKIVEWESDSLV